MAIYHLEAKVVSRGTGRSAVAASAYLSCSKILNDYDGVQHDYTRKKGLVWQEIISSSQFFLDMLNIIILLFGIIEVNVADKVHDISNIDSVTFHQLNAEIHIVQDGNNFTIFLLLCVKHQILALIVLIFLLAHDERVLVEAELNEGLK